MADEETTMSDSEESTTSDSEESAISDYQSALSDEGNDASGPVFSPQFARAVGFPALGKPIRLRIDLQSCKGLPEFKTSSDGFTTRASYYTQFYAIPNGASLSRLSPSCAHAGRKSPRGTVQWDDILYLECFERSIFQIGVVSSTYENLGATYRPVADLLTRSERMCGLHSS
ncbi:hypothetical protein PENSPDRAFT_446787 [Peniophora sp. CONT]|nr:hypothetical protein PENSPDRAFT_446787 [Peniophora sp. CONT]